MSMLSKIRYGLLIVGLIFSFFENGESRHIIGGEFYYETISPGNYEFTLIVYRDCASGGALFDSQNAPFGTASTGTVSVYRSDLQLPFDRVELGPPSVELIDVQPDNPCLIAPPSLCVERGEYTFRLQLPITNQTYTISYQRCCRNNTINNIVDPSSSGATYTIDISPLSQQVGNSSIQFSNFPPVVICSGEPLDFDHSAFDPDEQAGNTIEYEFCSPFLGGGLAGSSGNPGMATDPDGVAPDPDLPPPYNEVRFVGGEFTSTTPLGGDPVVTIDSQTGIISGVPENLGQFVVGVCATEYDSLGNVLSQVRRDFQFNVVECDAAVTASMEADSIDERGNFIFNACGRSRVQFNDASFLQRFISTHEWTFEVESGEDIISTATNPQIDFPDLGTYPGQLIVNKNTECSDTAKFLVNIFGRIENDFSFDYDTCRAGLVSFEGSSFTENDEIVERNWNIDNENTRIGNATNYEFRTPGDKVIIYEVIDDKGCKAVTEKVIPYYPIPNQIQIETEVDGECQPLRVVFNNLSYPLDESYDIFWQFGDGSSSAEISPTHIYEDAGVFDVSLQIISPIGCEYAGQVEQGIVVLESPIADFTYSPRSLSQVNNTAQFRDLSQLAEDYNWTFGDFEVSDLRNPTITFPDTGTVDVNLIVKHENGCTDTATQLIDVIPKALYFLPNAFRPDGQNSIYRGTGALGFISQFEMNIYDRWGQKIFTSSDPEIGWNGRKNNSGNMMPAGVYICQVRFVGPRGKSFQLREFATLIH